MMCVLHIFDIQTVLDALAVCLKRMNTLENATATYRAVYGNLFQIRMVDFQRGRETAEPLD